jgi:hypothetical protein
MGHFLQEHSYPFAGDNSQPPESITKKVHGNENFFNVQVNNIGAIAPVVSASVQDTTAPWAGQGMNTDLTTRITTLVEAPPTNAFFQQGFSLIYADPNDTSKAYQADICWVYCTIAAPDPKNPDQTVSTLFLYSVDVGYETSPWAERLKSAPPAIPVVRIAFALYPMIVGADPNSIVPLPSWAQPSRHLCTRPKTNLLISTSLSTLLS